MCRTCSGNDPAAAEAAFRARVAELGGQVVGPYVGVMIRVACVCVNGHECNPLPNSVQQGRGICYACSGKDPVTAEQKFRAAVAAQGASMIEEAWLGSQQPHRVICAKGHLARPRPASVLSGQGICRVCAGKDPETARRAFYARVAELGGKVVEPEWLGVRNPHRVICARGHESTAYPSNVAQGEGICRRCGKGGTWDAFYVVTSPRLGRVKFGVTSNDPRPRLASHRRAGYTETVRMLPDVVDAHALERHVLATLRDAGISAAQGREFFDISVLALVLDVVDGWAPRSVTACLRIDEPPTPGACC
jgi:hypothetical protein